jgi:propanol-preferring alcohol dehydrogenase
MHRMVLRKTGLPLVDVQSGVPSPGPHKLLIEVKACGVCRTDLHVVDGELPNAKPDVTPGHEIVGRVIEVGQGVSRFQVGDRVGVPWLGWTCGQCRFCRSGRENLCDDARFTGYTLDGGYADRTLAHEDFCFAIPEYYRDGEAAPLLCAGLIGYRCLKLAGNAERLGIYGFGAAAHMLTQVAVHQGRGVYAFTRPGDTSAQQFAISQGAVWAGDSNQLPPDTLDAAILFAPIGALVPQALAALAKGGVVVCGGIHMSDIPSFPYRLLWGERVVRSVANLTRADGEEFLSIAPQIPIRPQVTEYALGQANQALSDLRNGNLTGAAVLIPSGTTDNPSG